MKQFNKELIHDMRNALTIIIGNAQYLKTMDFEVRSCNAILEGSNRIVKVLDQVEDVRSD